MKYQEKVECAQDKAQEEFDNICYDLSLSVTIYQYLSLFTTIYPVSYTHLTLPTILLV